MRLRQLSQRLVKVFLELFVWQLCELFTKVSICKLLHVPLVVPANFLAFDSFIEQFSVEFAH